MDLKNVKIDYWLPFDPIENRPEYSVGEDNQIISLGFEFFSPCSRDWKPAKGQHESIWGSHVIRKLQKPEKVNPYEDLEEGGKHKVVEPFLNHDAVRFKVGE